MAFIVSNGLNTEIVSVVYIFIFCFQRCAATIDGLPYIYICIILITLASLPEYLVCFKVSSMPSAREIILILMRVREVCHFSW